MRRCDRLTPLADARLKRLAAINEWEMAMPLTATEEFRKRLLPKWIRFFTWLFLIAGAVTPLLLVIGIFYRKPMQFGLFGWEHYGSPYDLYSLLVMAYFVCSGFAAFGLLWGKRWGWAAGMTVGLVGLALALGSMFAHTPVVASQDEYGINFRLEPFFQIPFIFILWRRRLSWLSEVAPATA